MEVQKHSVHTLVFRSLKRTHDMFLADQANPPPPSDKSEQMKMIKARDEYGSVLHLVKSKQVREDRENEAHLNNSKNEENTDEHLEHRPSLNEFEGRELYETDAPPPGMEEMYQIPAPAAPPSQAVVLAGVQQQAITTRRAPSIPKPQWHPPWKLYRVVSGHLGWVRCLAVEPGNEWFATGSNDRIIKIWDLASGKLKLSLTGHISAVRGLAISSRQPYLFSCGEDKQVKCWDLEYNKVIRHYHGHLSGVYALALHPTIDILVTGGRDSCARVWDMRTKANIHSLAGHTNTVASVQCQAIEPQVMTGSHDCTIRLWDLVAGKTRVTLTHHKKSIRALLIHPRLNMFASGAPDNIKQWKCPDGNFIQNLSGHSAIVNCLGINADNVLVSGGDNGTLYFWDWRTGYNFQRLQAPVQPGSIDSEAGIFACTFDQSGSRLLSAEADKTVKIFKEDEEATEDTHPVNWKPEIIKRKRF
ncbi:pleiotropic regulator 1-like [Stegodyphus dumicola]|uniref:pleiotropic regulator 1-like n=1 Tax=Stegodyphus dumicola TaxID=202533 RepID=UPI0015B0C9D6|nr:pleiotropic regulator 1-like [Stegodyphus dumicola]